MHPKLFGNRTVSVFVNFSIKYKLKISIYSKIVSAINFCTGALIGTLKMGSGSEHQIKSAKLAVFGSAELMLMENIMGI